MLNDLGEEDKSSVSEDYSRNERLDKFGVESTIEVQFDDNLRFQSNLDLRNNPRQFSSKNYLESKSQGRNSELESESIDMHIGQNKIIEEFNDKSI